MATIAVIGTMDTKGEEHQLLAELIRASGHAVTIIDVGIRRSSFPVDVTNDRVATAAGETIGALDESRKRDGAIETMGRGAGAILRELQSRGAIHAAVALGGGGGTTLASLAFQHLPVGFPKLIVSTIAGQEMRPFLHGSDVSITYAVLDIAGLNPVTRKIIRNAAGAISGMATAFASAKPDEPDSARPMVAVTAFGVTSEGVKIARRLLEERGYEPMVFHAVGTGGESLEALIRAGYFRGVLDLTTTELVDDLVGGVMSAGPNRLTAASELGVPQVVSVGALDMANLGPKEGIATEFRARRLIPHNSLMTLMRTTVAENTELGARLAKKVSATRGRASVALPLRGTSSISTAGGPFHDGAADAALFASIRANLAPNIRLIEIDAEINDERFIRAAVTELIELISSSNHEANVRHKI
ncbi:Tm-1-like ATP-binding domain-containing protein [Roseateles chitinivorans]|uniref:Tm-1-like ATP-binding domain-containing protein n=1 Tax=Roseateles chitinivorans TaxID=2917965 RepID=UPI003D667442